jgi:hypothetical protein
MMASIALGNACWKGAVQMLLNKDAASIKSLLLSSEPYLRKIFTQELTDWVCTYWSAVEQS